MILKIQIILGLLFSTVLLTACGEWNYSPINTQVKFLKKENGTLAEDCNGKSIALRGGVAERFWKRNNLPKGTTEFTCIDGKAYLPEKVPPKN